jgi:hypothetical protein
MTVTVNVVDTPQPAPGLAPENPVVVQAVSLDNWAEFCQNFPKLREQMAAFYTLPPELAGLNQGQHPHEVVHNSKPFKCAAQRMAESVLSEFQGLSGPEKTSYSPESYLEDMRKATREVLNRIHEESNIRRATERLNTGQGSYQEALKSAGRLIAIEVKNLDGELRREAALKTMVPLGILIAGNAVFCVLGSPPTYAGNGLSALDPNQNENWERDIAGAMKDKTAGLIYNLLRGGKLQVFDGKGNFVKLLDTPSMFASNKDEDLVDAAEIISAGLNLAVKRGTDPHLSKFLPGIPVIDLQQIIDGCLALELATKGTSHQLEEQGLVGHQVEGQHSAVINCVKFCQEHLKTGSPASEFYNKLQIEHRKLSDTLLEMWKKEAAVRGQYHGLLPDSVFDDVKNKLENIEKVLAVSRQLFSGQDAELESQQDSLLKLLETCNEEIAVLQRVPQESLSEEQVGTLNTLREMRDEYDKSLGVLSQGRRVNGEKVAESLGLRMDNFYGSIEAVCEGIEDGRQGEPSWVADLVQNTVEIFIPYNVMEHEAALSENSPRDTTPPP